MSILRIKLCFLLIAWTVRGNVPSGLDLDELDATAGDTILVKTWSADSHLKSINITKDKPICVSEFFSRSKSIIPKNKHCAFQLQTNNSTRKMYLILGKVKKRYEGEYKVEESMEDSSPATNERTPGAWNFKFNVIGPKELKECEVGNNLLMNFKIWPDLRHLHYYDQIVATFNGSDCHVLNHSHLFRRLLYSIEHDRHVIIIQNVSQRDIGLFTLVNRKQDSQRFYLNVTDEPIYGLIGENVTISWHYSQQRTNRSLQIIHPNNGKMMSLSPDNKPKIGLAFQERLIYNGDITICYISLTLLNIGLTDSGVFRIETTHGITIPGCKQLVVKDAIIESEPRTVKHYTHLTDTPTAYNPVTTPYSQTNTLGIGVPIYVVLPMAVLILALIAYVVWIHQKWSCKCETDQSHSRKQHETGLYITPVGVSAHLPLQLMNDGHASVSNTAEWESSMPFLDTGEPRSMNEYDIVDISSTCSVDSVFSTDKTGYKETATTEHSSADNFGYLIVTDDAETEQT